MELDVGLVTIPVLMVQAASRASEQLSAVCTTTGAMRTDTRIAPFAHNWLLLGWEASYTLTSQLSRSLQLL